MMTLLEIISTYNPAEIDEKLVENELATINLYEQKKVLQQAVEIANYGLSDELTAEFKLLLNAGYTYVGIQNNHFVWRKPV